MAKGDVRSGSGSVSFSLAPDFRQVDTGGTLTSEPFQRFTQETVKTVAQNMWQPNHRTEVRC
jgi:hypothetical protein